MRLPFVLALFFYHTITATRFLKIVKVHRTDSLVGKRPSQVFSRIAVADFPGYDIILFLVLIGMIAVGKPTQQDALSLYESAKNIFEEITELIN